MADNRLSLQRLLTLNPLVVHGGRFPPMRYDRFRQIIEDYLAETA